MQKLGMAAQRIEALKEELKAWQGVYDSCLESVLESATFADSKFLKSARLKGQIYKSDGVGLIRAPVVSRIIRRDEFIEKYPEKFQKIGVVAIKDAEAAIGADKLSELCDLKTTYRYKVVSMEPPK
jgi:hypothetical protein